MKKKKKEQKSKKETLRERVADSLAMSKEVILDAAKLTFVGSRELTVENHKSIAEYTEKKIIIETNPHRIEISGQGLEIKSMTNELLYITGHFFSVVFKKEG